MRLIISVCVLASVGALCGSVGYLMAFSHATSYYQTQMDFMVKSKVSEICGGNIMQYVSYK